MANSIKDLLEFATKVRAGLSLQQPIHGGARFGFRWFQIHQVALAVQRMSTSLVERDTQPIRFNDAPPQLTNSTGSNPA